MNTGEKVKRNLFEQIHGTVNTNLIVPLSQYSDQELQENFKITREQLDEFCKTLEIDVKDLYYEKGAIINSICFLTDYEYYGFVSLDMEMLKFANMDLAFKKQRKHISECIKEKKFERVFMLIDKRVRFNAYQKFFDQIPDNQKYRLFSEIYSLAEYGFSDLDQDFIKEVFSYRELDDEYRPFSELYPEVIDSDGKVTIYRGATEQSTSLENAHSWTLSKKTADFFAHRFRSDGMIYKAKIDPSKIVDYNNYRGEEEVFVFYEDIEDIEEM